MATVRERVLANYVKGPGQFQLPGIHRREFAKVSAETVYDLLAGMRGPNQYKARLLLEAMSLRTWHIGATAHEGGTDPSAPLHITVFAPQGYHLLCKELPGDRVYVVDITARSGPMLDREQNHLRR